LAETTIEVLSEIPAADDLDQEHLLNVHPVRQMAKISRLTELQSIIGLHLKLNGESRQNRTQMNFNPEVNISPSLIRHNISPSLK
jgi:hypothetical protein